MHNYYSLPKLFFYTLAFICCNSGIYAQSRNYGIVYSDNIKGSTIMFGNTLMALYETDNVTLSTAKMNDNSATGNSVYGNDNANMRYVDIDTNKDTRNSSAADLVFPAGTNNIKLARLYWGGRTTEDDFDLTQIANQKIKLRKGTTGKYIELTASQLDKNTNLDAFGNIYWQYQAYVDITQFIKDNKSGTYMVGNAALSQLSGSFGGNYGGWCIVIVYENTTAFTNYNAIRVYDGFQKVYNGGSPLNTSVTLNGLNVPSGSLTLMDAKMGVLTWEGDANLKSDYLKINSTLFSNAINPVDNPWNGTISDNGVHVTNKNPNYTNQMAVDIDQFYVGAGYGIKPNADTVRLEFGTELDQYFPGLFTFVIKTKDLSVTLDKTVTDANNNHIAEAGEVLTYTLKGKNINAGNGKLTVVTDTLPPTVTYVTGSIKVISSPSITAGVKTDAVNTPAAGDAADVADYISASKTIVFRVGKGATNTAGGILAAGESFEIQFKVTVNKPSSGIIPPILNTARIVSYSDANIRYTDDGSAILEPQGGAVPVTLKTFTVSYLQDGEASINWVTAMEINCSEYDIERSTDGQHFVTVTTVKGNGTTSLEHTYAVTDKIIFPFSLIYYRIKQIDNDGRIKYSSIRSLRSKENGKDFIVSPNPFSYYININIEWEKNETATVRLSDILGKEVFIKKTELTKGLNYININEVSNLPSGNYILQVNSVNKSVIKKITK